MTVADVSDNKDARPPDPDDLDYLLTTFNQKPGPWVKPPAKFATIASGSRGGRTWMNGEEVLVPADEVAVPAAGAKA